MIYYLDSSSNSSAMNSFIYIIIVVIFIHLNFTYDGICADEFDDTKDSNLNYYLHHKILPDRLFTVFGLEASGTSLLARILSGALNVPGRDNFLPENENCIREFGRGTNNTKLYYEVQHISLPWGSTCDEYGNIVSIDIIPPECCFKNPSNSALNENKKSFITRCKTQYGSEIFKVVVVMFLP